MSIHVRAEPSQILATRLCLPAPPDRAPQLRPAPQANPEARLQTLPGGAGRLLRPVGPSLARLELPRGEPRGG
jgi:hypothetical protein